VFRARRNSDGMVVALKQIRIFDIMDENSREKCLKEIKLVQSLDHPNIIKYLDSFIENNQLHLVFEYAEVRALSLLGCTFHAHNALTPCLRLCLRVVRVVRRRGT